MNSEHDFESMGGLNVTDIRRERIPLALLWSTVGETVLAKGFCSTMGDMENLCVCRRTKLPGRSAHSEKLEK